MEATERIKEIKSQLKAISSQMAFFIDSQNYYMANELKTTADRLNAEWKQLTPKALREVA